MSHTQKDKLIASVWLSAAIILLVGGFALVSQVRAQSVGLMIGQPSSPVVLSGGTQNLIYGVATGTTGSLLLLENPPGNTIFQIAYDGSITSSGTLSGSNTYWTLNGSNLYPSTSYNVGVGITNPLTRFHASVNDVNNNSVVNVLTVAHETTGTAAVGIGSAIAFSGERVGGIVIPLTGRIKSILRQNDTPDADYWDMAFETQDNDIYVEGLRIRSNGNVGIGTTAPAGRLQIGAVSLPSPSAVYNQQFFGITNIMGRDSGEDSYIGNNVYYSSTPNWRRAVAGGAGLISFGSIEAGSILFSNAVSAAAQSVPTWVDSMTIRASGNVGIGLTNPGTKLEVSGTMRNSLATTHSLLGAGGNVTVMADNTGALYASSLWLANGTDVYKATTTGNVGIGITVPTSKLHVVGSGNQLRIDADGSGTNYSGYPLTLNRTGSSADGILMHGAYVNNATYYWGQTHGAFGSRGINLSYTSGILFYADGVATTLNGSFTPTERMRITNAGDVGIGTTVPSEKLQVQKSFDTTAANQLFNAVDILGYDTGDMWQGAGAGLTFSMRDSAQAEIKMAGIYARSFDTAANKGELSFHTGSSGTLSERVRIDYTGKVGIGIVNPQATLSVGSLSSGTAEATNKGVLQIASNADINGGSSGLEFKASASSSGYGWRVTAPDRSAGNTPLVFAYRANSATWTELVTMRTDTGNVGIGTSSPGTKLDVSGTFRNTTATTHSLLGGAGNVAVMADNTGTLYSSAGTTLPSGTSGQTLRHNGTIWTANSLLFNSGTAIGIGTTSPAATLQVAGSFRIGQSDASYPIQGGTDSINFRTAGTDYVYLKGEGIGTSDSGGLGLYLGDDSGTFFRINNNVTGELLRVAGTGNVGINNPSPASKLDVTGGFILSGDATSVSGSLILAGQYGGAADMVNTFGGQYSSGGTVIGYAVRPKAGAAGYTSAADNVSWARGATNLDSGGFHVLLGAAQAVAVGSDVAMTEYLTVQNNGETGVGLTDPGTRLDVGGTLRNSLATTHSLLANSGNVFVMADNNGTLYTGTTSTGYLPLSGGTMSGAINMGLNNITNVNKLNVQTIDPLYTINGVNYSTFVSSISGGVREEYVGKAKISRQLKSGEYEAILDFRLLPKGDDLWLWRQVVDFNKNNVDLAITPYGGFAQVYYLIDGNRLIFRADRPTEISYRLIGRRFDWRDWPTLSDDQQTKGLEPR